jgi:drug/metabolite transporter (DMT)-like permease
MRASLKADLALLGVAFVWGATFPVMKLALADASPTVYLALRFALAALLAMPLLAATRGRWSRGEVGAGLLLGGLLAASFALQTHGLERIGPARSAFLTSLYVVFVPLISVPLLGRLPRRNSLLGVGCALAGLGFMSWEGGGLQWRAGDLLTVAGALGFALHIIGVGVLTRRHDYRRLFVLQLASAAVLLVPAVLLETPRLAFSVPFVVAVVVTGGVATTLAFYVQNRVQRRSTPTRTAIIFAMEPVFALLVTLAFPGMSSGLSPLDGVGALLIMTGLVVAEIRLPAGPQSR